MTAARKFSPRMAGALIGSAVIVAALVAAGIVLFVQWRESDNLEQQRSQAQDATKSALTHALSYNYRTIKEDKKRALSVATGSFRKNLETLMSEAVLPNARKNNTVTTTAVTGTAVIDARTDEVLVLALLAQESTASDQQTPVVGSEAVRAQMRWVGDRWLISDLQPL